MAEFRSGRLSYVEREAIFEWLGKHATKRFRKNLRSSIKNYHVFNNVFRYDYYIFQNHIEYHLVFESIRHEQIFMWIENGTGLFGASERPIMSEKPSPKTNKQLLLKFIGTNEWAGLTLFRLYIKGIQPRHIYKRTIQYMRINDYALRRQARRELRI